MDITAQSARAAMHLANRVLEYSAHNQPPRIVDAQKGVVEVTRRKVAIVAAGPGKHEAPFDDPDWEVWALNVVGAFDWQGRLRCDRWWEMHEMHAQSADDIAWMRKCPVPLYMVPSAFAHDGEVRVPRNPNPPAHGEYDLEVWPNAMRYPLEAMEEKFGCYWACTFAYQMALAIAEGFTDIGLYGVELGLGTARERTVEWANVSWWIGFAEGNGITIHLPTHSGLGRHPARYGVEYDEEKLKVERYIAMVEKIDIVEDFYRQADEGMGG